MSGVFYDSDRAQTLANRARLRGNSNLMYWYGQLYEEQFRLEDNLESKKILEIGSGASPLKGFLPNVKTSDVLQLDHVDMVFDCHDIADRPDLDDGSLDVITMTNVLHHLRDPLGFLRNARRKLVKGGRIYMAEPYFSALSYPMYKLLHPEPVDFTISRPMLETVEGPLSTANQAMPFMIFCSRPAWLEELADVYDLGQTQLKHFSSISYPLTGGISRTYPVPAPLYEFFFAFDNAMARRFPRLFASFFIARLVAA